MSSNVATIPGTGAMIAEPGRYRGHVPESLDDSLRMAKIIVSSGMAPKSYFTGNADPIAAVWTAMQLGAEIGLSPMSAVQNVAVINGKPGLYGTGMLAVVEASGLLQHINEGVEGEGDARRGFCEVQRRGRQLRRYEFSMAEAKRARLAGKSGPWTEYPDRMLLSRARAFALRDNFADVLLGLAHSAEELMDITPEPERQAPPVAPAIEHQPAAESTAAPPAAPVRKSAISVRQHGTVTDFPRSRAGIAQALDVIEAAGAAVVMENFGLLDQIATMEVFAQRVADIRAAAARELAPDAEAYPGEGAGAEPPEPDEWSDAIATLRGARPAGMTDAEAAGLPE